jgi:hypothetical protein
VRNWRGARKLYLIRCGVVGKQRGLSWPWEGVGAGVAKCVAIIIPITCRSGVFENICLSNYRTGRASDISRHCCYRKCCSGKKCKWTINCPGYGEGFINDKRRIYRVVGGSVNEAGIGLT